MSRVLLICLLLFCASQSVFAQVTPGPNEPPQIQQPLTISAGGASEVIYFGLDLRASDGYDSAPGLAERNDLPPWSPSVEARFLRPGDGSFTYNDYRFPVGLDVEQTHLLQFQKGDTDNANTVTIAWELDPYVSAVMVDANNPSTELATMNGSGSVTIANNAFGSPTVTQVQIDVTYTDIPPELLPVELTAFNALLDDDVAHLSWETASELNNAGFDVEQKINGTFQTIAFVAGNGSTDTAQSYSYTTASLSAGVHTFRLKQVDFDGTFAYSDEVSVEVALEAAAVLSRAYPEPFNPRTQFTLTVAREQEVTINVYDMIGRHVQTLYQGVLGQSEAHLFAFEASNLPSGRYFIRATGQYFNQTQSVTLLK